MGQRLVTNVKRDGKIILSTYFHWTGYTSSSFELSSIMIDNIRKIPNIKTISPLQLAARIYEGTDHNPALDEDERSRVNKEPGTEHLFLPADRNEGLICVTDEGIAESANAGEVTVEIDLDKGTVIHDLLWHNDYIDEETDVAPATVLEINPEGELSFDDYQELAAFYLDNKDSTVYFLYKGVEYSGLE